MIIETEAFSISGLGTCRIPTPMAGSKFIDDEEPIEVEVGYNLTLTTEEYVVVQKQLTARANRVELIDLVKYSKDVHQHHEDHV